MKLKISEINEKATPTNTKTRFGLGVFQGKVYFETLFYVSILLTREAEIVTSARVDVFKKEKKSKSKENKLLD